jgi:hypothetical protein
LETLRGELQIKTWFGLRSILPLFYLPHNLKMLILGQDIQSMTGSLPFYIPLVFMLVTGLSIWFFYKAANSSRLVLLILCGWILIQGLIACSGYYTVTDTMPPRFLLLSAPPLLTILLLFLLPKGKNFLDQLDLKTLTLLHSVRLPVELVLYWLFLYKQIPELMTFQGRNYDVLSGLSAPLVLYYGFNGFEVKQKLLLFWNLICLGLLLNIVINALLSAPFPFQQFGFEQPNVAVLHFLASLYYSAFSFIVSSGGIAAAFFGTDRART